MLLTCTEQGVFSNGVKQALDEFSTEVDAECTGRNSRASSLQKDRGLGAGPHACEISHQSGDESLHTVS